MHIPILLLSGLMLFASAFEASVARAQEPVRAEREETPPAQQDRDAEVEPPAEAGRAPPAARPGIEEIVIQADESQAAADFEAGDSVAAFDASDLEALGAQSIEDLAAFTPNLEIVTGGATTPTFFIRGVGLNDFNPNSSGAVAIYQDDVPLNSPALQLGTLFDIDQVNILRGPQGTGSYRNASAGAIKIYSRRPTGEYGAYLLSSYGNYNFLDFEGAVEAPIYEDIVASRFAFRWSQRDGYGKNGCGDAVPYDERGVRDGDEDETDPFDEDGKPLSLCGEAVKTYQDTPPIFRDGKSPIPEGLPTEVNDLGNWAARGVLLFQPTLDMEWQFTAHGARRDELSRLGQAYGTTAQTYDPECLATLPPDKRHVQSYNKVCKEIGSLGGKDAGGESSYIAPEVTQRIFELDTCRNNDGTYVPECTTDPITQLTQSQRFEAANLARIQVAQELAADLDTKPHRGDYDRVGPTTNDVWGLALKGDIALGNSLFLTTVTGYDTYDRLVDIDLDFSPNPLFEIRTADQGWQFAQIVSLAGQVSEDLGLRWELGGYYLQERLDVDVKNTFSESQQAFGVSAREYTQRLWTTAGYASFEWDFWDDFTLDGGVRYNWEKKTIDYFIAKTTSSRTEFQEKTWQAPTGTIRLTYRFREDTHAFWKYTRGWKGGHFNATSSLRTGVTAAEPETIDAFEAGLRGSWFDGRLGLDFSVFHYSYGNYQIFTAQQQFASQPEFVVLNASDAEVYGADLDIVARPLPGMYLQARLSWLESTFLDFVQEQTTNEPVGTGFIPIVLEIQNSGNPLLNSPNYKVALTAEQTLPLGRFGSLTARWDGAWTDDTNFDPTAGLGVPNRDGVQFLPENTIGQRAFWLHNLRLAYRTPSGNVEVAGWVRNLTDEVYKTFAFDGSTFNKTTIYFVGEPRMYGLTVSATF